MRCSKPAIRLFLLLAGTLPLSALPDTVWPRQYTDGDTRLTLYQPQVDSWTDFKKLSARFAATLTPSKHAQTIWGVLSIEFDTSVDLKTRIVTFGNFRVLEVRYPLAKNEAEHEICEALTIKLLPTHPTAIALDRVLAYMDESRWHARETEVMLDPPPILVSTRPAVLVIIEGKPILIDVAGTNLQKIVNTNWDLFYDRKGQRFYLRDDKVWLTASTLSDAWTPATQLLADFTRLPATDLYKESLQSAARPEKPAVANTVYVADKPTELIVLAGNPVFTLIPETRLMWVTNTECDLFYDPASRDFYFLTSGRWFRTRDLTAGQWTAVAALPPDFSRIPPDHPRAHVLAAVAGTRQASEAVMNASIPQVSTLARAAVSVDVKYAGEPKFETIAAAGVAYALNTPGDVLRVSDRYYLCREGTWLMSSNAAGPWQAADSIPKEIYAIPPDSPKHHVTYVTVSSADPDAVTYRYSAGYHGMYVAHGVVVWGTGYSYPPYVAPGPIYWPSAYYTYGASTWYSPAVTAFVRGSVTYGPYGGYPRAAAYDPATRAYSWARPVSALYGPRYRISTGQPIQTSVVPKQGDVYAGKDGNVYRRDPSGRWAQNSGKSWVSVLEVPSKDAVGDTLSRDSSARNWGNYNAQRAESRDKLNGWTGDPFVGRGMSGWSFRSPGFGGKK